MSTNRLEAFSDGVIAVAITLLVLNIELPELKPHQSLAGGLISQWPVYVAYAVSFLTIGIIWVNHHVMIARLGEVDRTILFLNLLLLMSIAVLPFATRLMAAYLRNRHGQHLATGVYSGAFLVMALFFAALNRHILLTKAHLLQLELSLDQRRQILSRSVAGVVPYAIATALAVVSAYVTLGICAALAIFYALPVSSGGAGAS